MKSLSAVSAHYNKSFVSKLLTSSVILIAAALFLAAFLSGCGGKNEPTVVSIGGKTVVIADSSGVEKSENPWQVTLKATDFVRLAVQLPGTTTTDFRSFLQGKGINVKKVVDMGGGSYDFVSSIPKDVTLDLKGRGVLTLAGNNMSWQSPGT